MTERQSAKMDSAIQWRQVCLGDVLKLRKEVVHPRDKPIGKDVFVGLQHVESHTGRRIGVEEIELSELTGRKPRFYAGDIVYGYLRPYLNKVWLAEFDGLCSVDQYVYEVDTEIADANYVACFMRSPTYLGKAPVGETPGQLPRIRTEEVSQVRLRLPPLAHQQEIVKRVRERLAEASRARSAVDEQLCTAQRLQSALLRDVFQSAHSATWDVHALGDLLEGIDAGKCVNCIERRADSHEWGVLKVSAVTWGEFREQENKVLPRGYPVPERSEVRAGDFLISRSNTIELVGAVALVRKTRPRLMLSDKTLRLVPRPDAVCSEFLEFALRTPRCREFIERNATGASSSMKNIKQDAIRRIPVPVPPIETQRALATRLQSQVSDAATLNMELKRRLAELERIPAALLRDTYS